MESMLQVLPVKLDKAAPAETGRNHEESQKCQLASEDPPLLSVSSGFKDTVDSNEEENNSQSESVASEDSECSLESDASSNALSGDSLVSNAHSIAPSCEEKNLKRSPSGSSIVTYDEAASKLRGGVGDCVRTVDRKVRRFKGGRSSANAFFGEQDPSINTVLRICESAGPAWTDDKHCSYLNSIEATFVQSLYGQDFCALGQDDQDCVESRPMFHTYGNYPPGCEFFTSLQRGCYDQREYYRPHSLHHFAPSTSAVFASPWIQHFNPRMSLPNYGGSSAGQDAFTVHTSTGFVEEAHCSTFVKEGVNEEVMESIPDIPEMAQDPQPWSNRFHSQLNASTSAPMRADTSAQARRHPCNLDPCSDVVFRPKKHKAVSKRSLAEMDLEMEEQFVLKQKSLKDQTDSDLKEDGCGLKIEEEQKDDKVSEEMSHCLPQDILYRAKNHKTVRSFAEIDLKMEEQFHLKQRNLKEHADHSDPKERLFCGHQFNRSHEHDDRPVEEMPNAPGASRSYDLTTICKESLQIRSPFYTRIIEPSDQQPVSDDLREDLKSVDLTFQGESIVCKKAVETYGHCAPSAPRYDEIAPKVQGYRILSLMSPPASTTYAYKCWGSTGTRRLHRSVQSESNALVDGAALTGSVNEQV